MLPICHNYFRVSSCNKNNKDGPQPFNKRKYAFGVFILLLVVILWVLSSELTKYIYTEKHLDRPFLVTYVRSSLLFIYLLVLCFAPPTKDPCRPTDYTQLLEPSAETDDENYYNEATNSLGDSTFVPVRAGETTDSDDAAPRAVRFNKVAEVRVMSAALAGEALLARLSWQASVRASEHAQRRAAAAATRRHLRLAAILFLPWFISNYLYRLSLLHTTSSTATVYTSAGGPLALCAGALLAPAPQDRLTAGNSVAAVATAAGLVVLGVSQGQQSDWAGVVAALGAAACYSAHLLLLRQQLRKGDGLNAPLLVGLVGMWCAAVSWAVGGALGAAGAEAGALPAPRVALWLLLDAALGPILMDSLWLWGRSLTSSQTATAMLGLTAPLAACVDIYRGVGGVGPALGVAGAALLAAVGWAAAVCPLPTACDMSFITDRMRAAEGFTVIRNLPDLDEQSESLMSSEELT